MIKRDYKSSEISQKKVAVTDVSTRLTEHKIDAAGEFLTL